jgi:hypothetical protein
VIEDSLDVYRWLIDVTKKRFVGGRQSQEGACFGAEFRSKLVAAGGEKADGVFRCSLTTQTNRNLDD